MSRNVRTARGTMIDMSALATKHEMTKAVSNVNMNARGDRLNDDGSVSGGPMYYLSKGLKDRGFMTLGKILGAMYAVFIIGLSLIHI